MTDDIAKRPAPLDEFLGYTEESLGDGGDDRASGGGMLPGVRMKFDNTGRFVTHPDGVDYTGREVIVTGMRRVIIRFGDDNRPETEELAPGEPWPDLVAKNDAVPKSEWREDLNGKLVGPWQAQRIVEFFDPSTLTRFAWPTSTIGGRIAINDVLDKMKWIAKFHRDEAIYPMVELTSKTMKTNYGPRPRPHLEVKRWVRLGEHGVEPVNVDSRPMLQQRQVREPSRQEEMKDELPY